MKVNFYHRKSKGTGEGAGHIEVSFSWEGNRVQVTTGEACLLKYWNSKRRNGAENYVLKGQSWWAHKNKKLRDIKTWAGDIYYEYTLQEKKLTTDLLKKVYRDKFLSTGEQTVESQQEINDITIKAAFDIAMEKKKAVTRAKTAITYQTTVNHFMEFLGDKANESIDNLNSTLCNSFIDHLIQKKFANKTLNNQSLFLSTLLNTMVKSEILKANPYKPTFYPEEETTHFAFTENQIKDIFTELKSYDKIMYLNAAMIFYGFLRPKELRSLRIENIKLKDNVIFLPANVSKNRISRTIEILPPLKDIIMKYDLNYPGHFFVFGKEEPGPLPVGTNYFNTKFREFFTEMELGSEYTVYSFKHTGVIMHFLAGFDLRWLQDQTGHKDISNLMKYLRSLGLKVNRSKNIQAPLI